jgi:hypothetical protein
MDPTSAVGCVFIQWCMSLSLIGFDIWMAANGYAVWATMVPASALVGLCSAPLWTAMNSYLALAAQRYGTLTGQDTGIVMAKFFGIFYAILRFSKASLVV